MEREWKLETEGIFIYPEGLTQTEDKVHFTVVTSGKQVKLCLFEEGEEKAFCTLPFPKEAKFGNLWSAFLPKDGLDNLEYAYEIDGVCMPDACARRYRGRETWGDAVQAKNPARSVICFEEFDWEGDQKPNTPFRDTVVYKCHVRGFTAHSSSQVEHKATFAGITEKIPYLKALGVTALELMPMIEFEEVMMQERRGQTKSYRSQETDGRLNYWGYVAGAYFAPKSSYSSEPRNPEREFKTLVKTLHKNGMELYIDLFFTGQERPAQVLDILRFWVREYHVDGIHMVGFVPEAMVGEDACLCQTKLFYSNWNAVRDGEERHLAEYNDGFQNALRCFLKGDEDKVGSLAMYVRRNPAEHAVINFMANNNGFTMMDLVSYDQKHNEENGENNQDGSMYNYSWNCGVEGETRKKKVLELRRKQLRNAFALLFLSQGTPLLLAGDEFGNSKKGNNNSYCQDNEVSWLDWKLLEKNADIYEFVSKLIAFRKEHPVLHQEKEAKMMDYLACGCPDVSYHGVKAWCPEYDYFRRQLGVMYCGEYAQKSDGSKDAYLFVAYNSHWEPHEFALPNLPRKMKWHIAINTDDAKNNGMYPEGKEPLVKKQKQFMVPARSILVFLSKAVTESEKEKEKAKEKTKEKTGKK
ncbi:MAG: alpha-amylase family glycosyl hydrolase [bacterium]|nr:alpha-amylase family glycosyl hydrolase [bacterium]